MNLQELHKKYSANKVYSYMSRYEELFKDLKDREIRLLELGIWKGDSLRMWRDYFQKGQIVGIDRNPKWMIIDEERIKTLLCDQKDIPFTFTVITNQFDIIIDDMSHIGSLTKESFRHLFDNNLKPGGIYVIEDWLTGYYSPDKNYEGTVYVEGVNHLSGMVGFVKELIDDLARKKTIDKIIYFEGMVFVYKK